MHRLFCWLLLHTYQKTARVVELWLNMEWQKLWVLGSNWTLLPKNSEYFRPPPYHHPEVDVGLPGGKICMHSIIFSFLCEQTFLTVCHSKIHQNYLPFLRAFSELIQKICRPINVFQQVQTGFLSLCYFFNQEKCKRKTVFGNRCISHPTQSSNECT